MPTAIKSTEFSKVYLRMDAQGVNSPGPGGGVVNCQYSLMGDYEKFHLRGQSDGTFAFESVAFPGRYLRMDGRNVPSSGGGTVNCQYGVSDWEKFYIVPQGNGTVAVVSKAFPQIFLRMDGKGVTSGQPNGGGVVNCQTAVGPYEKFELEILG